ncbi:MAG: hypothetical protein J7K68_05050 [Candidatus Diapherotrites archaeon]|nr:hypothetical protein [Candidatus Diapherotrites archaeon]
MILKKKAKSVGYKGFKEFQKQVKKQEKQAKKIKEWHPIEKRFEKYKQKVTTEGRKKVKLFGTEVIANEEEARIVKRYLEATRATEAFGEVKKPEELVGEKIPARVMRRAMRYDQVLREMENIEEGEQIPSMERVEGKEPEEERQSVMPTEPQRPRGETEEVIQPMTEDTEGMMVPLETETVEKRVYKRGVYVSGAGFEIGAILPIIIILVILFIILNFIR